jgi:hypothetical protein
LAEAAEEVVADSAVAEAADLAASAADRPEAEAPAEAGRTKRIAVGETMSINSTQQHLLDDLLAQLKHALGDNLDSLVLYGSAAGNNANFSEKYSDLNVMCLVNRLDAKALRAVAPVIAWWEQQKQPAPMLFAIDELRRSADVFAIELLDIKQRHKVLFGADHFSEFEVPMDLHRVAVERELRTNLIKLRQKFMLIAGNDAKPLIQLMAESVSTFATLFRHSLIALGEQPPAHKRDAVTHLADKLHFERKPFDQIFDLREGKLRETEIDAESTFAGYLTAIERVVDEVDKRLG